MKINKDFLLSVAIAIVLGFTNDSFAQGMFGLQNSNFSGSHQMYTNPANLTTLSYRRYTNLSTFALSADNNYFALETPFPIFKLATGNVPTQYKNANGKVAWNPNYLTADASVNSIWGNVNMEWRGPSHARRLGQRLVYAWGMRTRANMAVKDLDPKMATWVNSLADSSSVQNLIGGATHPFNFQANAYQEMSASLSYNFINVGGFRAAIGGTVKYLMGLGHFSIINNGADIQTFGMDSIRINQSNMQVAYSDPQFMQRFMNGMIGGVLPTLNSIMGGGFGFDVGIFLEGGNKDRMDGIEEKWIIPDMKLHDYGWKLSAALTDWGSMNYGQQIKQYTVSNTTPVSFPLDTGLAKAFAISNQNGLKYVENFAAANMNYSKVSTTAPLTLPTMLQIQGDLRVFSKIFVGMHWQQSLVSVKTLGFRTPSSLVVIPRFETAWFECSMPVSLTQDYKRGAVGAYFRVGPIFIGSDNLVTTVLANKAKGFNLYFGVAGGVKPAKRTKRG